MRKHFLLIFQRILNHFIFTFLFCLGLLGITLNRQNIKVILMSIELFYDQLI